MGVRKYRNTRGSFWKIDVSVTLPDGRGQRILRRKIPTREQAVALEAKIRAEAFEGRYFDRLRIPKVTVAQLWKEWEPISRRSTPDRRDRILLVGAIAAALLTLLGAAGEAVGEDRRMRANTSKERTHSLLNQGLFYFDCLSGMREERARLLMSKFDELVRQNATFREIFGLTVI